MACGQENGFGVHGEDLIKFCFADLIHRLRQMGDASIVDQNINPSPKGLRRADHMSDRAVACDIHMLRRRCKWFCDGLRGIQIDICDHHCCTFGSKLLSYSGSKA